MLIIVEGPNGAGKSMLIERLATAIRWREPKANVKIRSNGPLPSGTHPLDAYERPLFGYRPGTGEHIIYDRHFIGEWIYPTLFQRDSVADLPTWRHINMFLQSRGAVIVYARPPEDALVRTFRERGDELVQDEDIVRMEAKLFDSFMPTVLPKVVNYDFTVTDPAVINRIMYEAHTAAEQARPLNKFETYIGHPDPRYLLLGDVRHGLRSIDPQTVSATVSLRLGPAFGPYRATSGHYLLTHLAEHNTRATYGIANACDVDDVAELRRVLNYPDTVALGINAYEALTGSLTGSELRAKIGRAPHPQYVRRFANARGAEYGQRISSALSSGGDYSKGFK